jgi:hypothetical protein
MTPFYLYRSDSDRYHSLVGLVDDFDFDGTPLLPRWQSPVFEWELAQQQGDFPRLAGHVPAFSERAKQALAPLLKNDVEFLPLRFNDESFGPYWAVHVLPILDCLEPSAAEVERADDGAILFIDHYVFRESVVAKHPIFRIAGYEFSHCYVSEAFKQVVDEHRLKGLLWRPLP